jgi:hypothetical protein
MDIDGLIPLLETNMVLFIQIIMFIDYVNMKILDIKVNIINGKSPMRNMKHSVI